MIKTVLAAIISTGIATAAPQMAQASEPYNQQQQMRNVLAGVAGLAALGFILKELNDKDNNKADQRPPVRRWSKHHRDVPYAHRKHRHNAPRAVVIERKQPRFHGGPGPHPKAVVKNPRPRKHNAHKPHPHKHAQKNAAKERGHKHGSGHWAFWHKHHQGHTHHSHQKARR